jgi:hypothetical protein
VFTGRIRYAFLAAEELAAADIPPRWRPCPSERVPPHIRIDFSQTFDDEVGQ